MQPIIKKLLGVIANKYGCLTWLYLTFGKPSPEEYSDFLRNRGSFYHIGKNCWIMRSANITDPEYVSLGDNVMLSACSLLGHDGSIHMLNIAYNTKLDKVGKIEIGNNVFIGHNAIVLPGITIGSNVIVGAGSLVTHDISDGNIVGGVPATVIGKTDDYVEKLKKQTRELPWYDLLKKREGSFDPAIEPLIIEKRVAHFYDKK